MKLAGIEFSSTCQLRCEYCPQSNFGRVRKNMTEATFATCLGLISGQGEIDEIRLAGIGESTLHPQFSEWVMRVREAAGHGTLLSFSTNGISFTDEHIFACRKANIEITLSPHDIAAAAKAARKCKDHGLPPVLLNMYVLGNPHNWAGQVDWLESTQRQSQCGWIARDHVMCHADGMISTCCFDGTGKNILGPIENFDALKTGPGELCKTCHFTPGDTQ